MIPDKKPVDDDNSLRDAVDELLTDPDSADKGHTSPPPQTIDAEPDGS